MSSISGVSSSDNMLRITGLATGMDTDSMVTKMLAGENTRLDQMKQDRQYVQWRQDAFRDIIKSFRDLRSNYLLIGSPTSTNVMQSLSYSGSTITSDYPNSVTATALPGAVNGTTTVTVNKIAKSAQLDSSRIGTNSVTRGNYTDWNNKTMSFNVNGTSYDTGIIDTTGVTDNAGLAVKINDAINSNVDLKGKIKASVTDTNVTFNVLTSDSVKITGETGDVPNKLDSINNIELNPATATKLSDIDPTFGSQDFYIKQSGKVSSKITITKDDTIQGVITKIYNAQAKDGDTSSTLYSDLQISYSDLTKSLNIQTRNTGNAQSLQITSDAAGTTPLNLGILGLTGTSKPGQDAEVSITAPGSSTPTLITKSSNTFNIDNVTYNLIKDPGENSSYTVTLTTKADSQSSFDKIKGFIDTYNALVEKINNQISEKKAYDYKPLTDTQKKGMSDTEIKSWEDKAKQGILKNDSDLRNVLSNLRSAFMGSVASAGISLHEIGIDTYGGTESITKPGQFKIDETKLKTALETRGDQVAKIFTALPDATIVDATEKYNNTGIFNRVKDILYGAAVDSNGTLLKRAGYPNTASEASNIISDQLKQKDKAISDMNDKISKKQQAYYQMFAKLESAMNQMNSQQSWLTQQLSGGN